MLIIDETNRRHRSLTAGAAPRRRLFFWHALLFGCVCVIIWLPGRFLTQDGPSHIYTAHMFGRLLQQPRNDCFQMVAPPPPNSMTAWTGAVLIPIFGTAVTEKIWATLYALLLVAGGWRLARRIDPGNSALGVYLFLLNPFFFAGFWNFNLAVGILFLAAAYSVDLLDHPSLVRGIIPLSLVLILYFTHLFAFAAFLVVMPFLLITKSKDMPARRGVLGKSGFYPVLFFLVLAGMGIVGGEIQSLRLLTDEISFSRFLGDVRRISITDMNVWYRYGEQEVLPLLELAVLVIAAWRAARRQLPFHFTLLLIVILSLFFLFPDQLGGAAMMIKARLWLLLVLLASLCLHVRWTHWIGAACAALLFWHAWQVLPRQVEWNQQMSQLLQVSGKLERRQMQASLMGIYWGRASQRPRIFPQLHADLLLAAESDGISLSSNQLWSGTFAVRYLGSCAVAAGRINGLLLGEISAPADISGAIASSAVRYVVIWKAGTLPWSDLQRRWRILRETPDFLVADTQAPR